MDKAKLEEIYNTLKDQNTRLRRQLETLEYDVPEGMSLDRLLGRDGLKGVPGSGITRYYSEAKWFDLILQERDIRAELNRKILAYMDKERHAELRDFFQREDLLIKLTVEAQANGEYR